MNISPCLIQMLIPVISAGLFASPSCNLIIETEND
ncbi:Protein of unknown function [Lactobacillus helveticus CIRM-BIA 103]|nr:Protein of unknown function [Lactobacillus helveticus CIRM-BIA 103]